MTRLSTSRKRKRRIPEVRRLRFRLVKQLLLVASTINSQQENPVMDSSVSTSESSNQTPRSAVNGLENLPQFPGEAILEVTIRARRIPIVEISAGVLIGVLIGGLIGAFDLANELRFGVFSVCVGFDLLVVGVIGWIVGLVTGPTGKYSVATVLAAVPRVLLASTIGLLFGVVFGMMEIVLLPQPRNDND